MLTVLGRFTSSSQAHSLTYMRTITIPLSKPVLPWGRHSRRFIPEKPVAYGRKYHHVYTSHRNPIVHGLPGTAIRSILIPKSDLCYARQTPSRACCKLLAPRSGTFLATCLAKLRLDWRRLMSRTKPRHLLWRTYIYQRSGFSLL